jgi:hypothetical protein
MTFGCLSYMVKTMPSKRLLYLVAILFCALYSRVNASQIPFEVPVTVATAFDPTTTTTADTTYTLSLPYATYLGTLDETNDILLFSNVRYAAAPTGGDRWQTPKPPLTTSGIQNGSQGGSCFAALPNWVGKVILAVTKLSIGIQR